MLEVGESIAIIIPCVDPDEKLLSTVFNLFSAGFKNIIIIDDGSDESTVHYFEKAKELTDCLILSHAVNLGKGRALKTAFNFILTKCPDITYAVTIDSDGQHSVEDVKNCFRAISKNQEELILGVRNFTNTGNKVPFRSKFGNIITKKVLQLFCSINITDTQTGLRVFSRNLMKEFLKVPGERFEYEMNMLLRAKEKDIIIKEVPIKTIYIENNKTSHFNPLTDSLKIYATISKFIISSFASFVIDISVFYILSEILKNKISSYLILSAYLSRAMSSLFNYSINKSTVFKNKSKNVNTLIKYVILCVGQITLSAFLTQILFNLIHINATFIKIVIDFVLFLINFKIQSGWVFK